MAKGYRTLCRGVYEGSKVSMLVKHSVAIRETVVLFLFPQRINKENLI